MNGNGAAGKANFYGHLNADSGRISGRWAFPGLGTGSFSARQERQDPAG